jgi:hypothetical protein
LLSNGDGGGGVGAVNPLAQGDVLSQQKPEGSFVLLFFDCVFSQLKNW